MSSFAFRRLHQWYDRILYYFQLFEMFTVCSSQIGSSSGKMGFKGQRVRTQLLVIFGGLVAVSFGIVFIICVNSVSILRDSVLRECDKALRLQIANNSNFILAETADVLEAKMQTGLKSLALPAALAIHGAGDPQYSVTPPATSYADSSKDTLKAPLTTDFRYPCLASESAALQARRGCVGGLKTMCVQIPS